MAIKKKITHNYVDLIANNLEKYRYEYKKEPVSYWQNVFHAKPYWVVYQGKLSEITSADMLKLKNMKVDLDIVFDINNKRYKTLVTGYVEGYITKTTLKDKLYKEIVKNEKNYAKYKAKEDKLTALYRAGKIELEDFTSRKNQLRKKYSI